LRIFNQELLGLGHHLRGREHLPVVARKLDRGYAANLDAFVSIFVLPVSSPSADPN
jgi:hypothetical protein